MLTALLLTGLRPWKFPRADPAVDPAAGACAGLGCFVGEAGGGALAHARDTYVEIIVEMLLAGGVKIIGLLGLRRREARLALFIHKPHNMLGAAFVAAGAAALLTCALMRHRT